MPCAPAAAVAAPDKDLDAVMTERFGHRARLCRQAIRLWVTDAEPGRQRVPDPQRQGHADGRSAAPLLDAGTALRGAARARRPARRRSGSWARTCSPSATATAGSASSSRTARIAAPISTTAATRSAACVAPSTAGSSTSTATASTCRPRRRNPPTRTRSSCSPIRCANGPTSIWVYMGPREHVPELPQLELGLVPAAQPLRLQEVAGLQLGAEPRRRASTPRTSRSCTRCRPRTRRPSSRSSAATSAIGAGQELQDRIRWVMDDPRPKFAIARPRHRPGDRRARARPTAPTSTGASRSS